MVPPSDLEINRQVRKLLVRYNINLGWITILSCRGNVQVSGNLLLLSGTGGELSSPVLRNLFQEIARTQGVRRVSVELNNWSHNGALDAWKLKDAAVPAGTKLRPTGSGSQVFDLSDDHH
jgi:hypothetical protein